jgi:hypothetical protein
MREREALLRDQAQVDRKIAASERDFLRGPHAYTDGLAAFRP